MKVKWPRTVPHLTERDIYCGDLDGGDGTHCLMGWARTVFPDVGQNYGEFVEDHPVILALADAVRIPACAKGDFEDGETVDKVIAFNDSYAGESKKRSIANAWNRAMAKLGYTEITA